MLLGINLLLLGKVNAARHNLLLLVATVKVKMVNGEQQLQALVDGKKIVVIEAYVRRDLQLDDEEGTDCLPNATIFKQLTLIGYEKLSQKLTFYKEFFSPQWKFLIHTILQCLSAKTTAWNVFSSTMASAIICLATNQKFNFSKYIFESMVKNLDNAGKFLMYPRFIQVFLDNQLEGMSSHKRIYVTPSHTKKIFANMRRQGKDFSGRETPLFPTMVVQAQEEMGEGSAMPTDPHHTPIITQPSSSQPQRKQKSRRSKRKDTEVPQPSDPINVADEAVNEEPSMQLKELMDFCTKLQQRVLDLENTKTAQAQEITSLKKRVKKVVSSDEASLGDQEDVSKQGRKIDDIDANKDITLENVHDAKIAAIITEDEITLAQALVELKSIKPKVTTTTTATTKGILLQEPSESITRVKAKIETDYELAQRLQVEEQEELTIEEEVENMAGWKPKDLKNKFFANIQELFNKAMKRVNTFVDMDTKLLEGSEVRVEGSETREESSSKREGDEIEQEKAKKQKVDEDKETARNTTSSMLDYKTLKEGKINYYQIIRADGRSKSQKRAIKECYGGRIVGIKRLLDDLRVTAALLMLLVYKLLLLVQIEYDVSTSIGYGVSSSLSNTAYSSQQINTTYPLPLDTTYRSSGTEAEIFDLQPEREFRSSRRHFKTLSLDKLRSPHFNLLSDQEYSEEEEAKAMAETMEQYMNKTRTDYGSGVARPKIDNKDQFELKGQFLLELRENTFSGSDNEDANEHIEKVLKIVDLFHVPNITEVILFYNGLDIPTRQILDSRGAIPTKTAEDAKKAIQEMAKYSQKWHNGTSKGRSTWNSDGLAAIQAQLNNLGREIKKVNEKVYAAQVGWRYRATAPGYYQRNNANPSYQERRQSIEDTLSKFMSESTKRHEENSNLIKEIRATTDAAIRNQGASIKTLEIQIGQMSKVLQERGFGSLPSLTKTNPRDQVKLISTTIEADSHSIRRIGSSQYAISTGQNRASISVMPLSTYLNLGLGELAHTRLTVELADRTVKYPKGIAENVLVGIGKFTFPVDFIILDILEDIKVPLILERLFLFTTRAKIDVSKRKITLRVGEEKIIFKSVKHASSMIKRVYMLSLRERMELDLESRLIGETLVLNRSLDPFLEDYIELNDLNEPFELRRNQGMILMPTH
ncbi:DNA-directed DNA polymerase [Tanacetum coccineum]